MHRYLFSVLILACATSWASESATCTTELDTAYCFGPADVGHVTGSLYVVRLTRARKIQGELKTYVAGTLFNCGERSILYDGKDYPDDGGLAGNLITLVCDGAIKKVKRHN